MQIFAFLGPARAGKTTAADALDFELRERGLYVERLSMAAPIKEGMKRVGITKSEKPDEYRALAQRWGATRRARNSDHYVAKALRSILRTQRTELNDYTKLDADENLSCWDETAVIIDDIRYPNEVALMKRLDATVVWVDAGDRINFSEPFRQHESEALANQLAHDHDMLEDFLDECGGWVLDAAGDPRDTAAQLLTYIDRVWFGVFAYTDGLKAIEDLLDGLTDEDEDDDGDAPF